MRKKVLKIMAAAISCLIVLNGCSVEHAEDSATKQGEAVTENKDNIVLNVKYYDETYTEYLEYCKESFEKNKDNVTIELTLMSSENYIANISESAYNGTDTTDVYMAMESELGKAYLAGIAADNNNEDFTSNYYCDTALNACSYNGKLIAYPLSYDTSYLVYNTAYMSSENVTDFSTIKSFAENADFTDEASSSIQRIFNCNITRIFENYGFIGNSMNIGGTYGDDSSSFSINNADTVKDAERYMELIEYFSLSDLFTYDECIGTFVSGSCLSMIASVKQLSYIDENVTNLGITEFPDYDEENSVSPLSITTALVVNPFSEHDEYAEEFAWYATYGKAVALYKYSNMLSAKNNVVYDNEMFDEIYKSYEKSTPKNKILYGEQLYPHLEIALHNIISGSSAADELKAVDEYMQSQF